MESGLWWIENWFSLAQTLGIIASLLLASRSFQRNAKAQSFQSLVALLESHREIWSMLIEKPELSRVLEPDPDLQSDPPSPEERRFVQLLILHLSTTLRAINWRLIASPPGLSDETRDFFSHPIPLQIWREVGPLQDRHLRCYVDERLKNNRTGKRWRIR